MKDPEVISALQETSRQQVLCIRTLTQERDGMRVVLTSEIDARIRAESRALTADGLRVQLAEAQDRLTLCTAEVQRLRQEMQAAAKKARERQEALSITLADVTERSRERGERAEKAEAERDEARDCLARTIDERDEAQADRDAAKTRIAAALRCMGGRHYPAAIQALTIGAEGCVLPPDPVMLERLEKAQQIAQDFERSADESAAELNDIQCIAAQALGCEVPQTGNQPALELVRRLAQARGGWRPVTEAPGDAAAEGQPDPKGTEKAGHVGWLLHAHDPTWQAKHQGPPAGCKGCAEYIEIPLTEMRRERDEWKTRAKEAEDRASYFAKGRNKASATADKFEHERDEARAKVARLTQVLTEAKRVLDWGHKEMNGRPPQHWIDALAAVDQALSPDPAAPSGEDQAVPDLRRAILLLVTRPAPTFETIQQLCRWIGSVPYLTTHRVLMDLCKSGRVINRGLPDGFRLADEAAVHIEAPIAPEQAEPIPVEVPTGQEDQHDADMRAAEPPEGQTCQSTNHGIGGGRPCENQATWRCAHCRRWFCTTEGAADGHDGCDDCWASKPVLSWERAREAWRAISGGGAYAGEVTAAIRMVDACIYRGECGWINAAQDTHNAIDRLEQAAKDARLWTVGQKFAHPRPDQLTPLALAIIDLRAKTPRPDPIPANTTGESNA